jgi:hypothetical protein
MRAWAFGVGAALVVGLAAITAWTMTSFYTVAAQELLDRADPLDRAPPPAVTAVLDALGLRARMAEAVSVVLLDGRSRGAGVDWSIERPLIVWHLKRRFTQAQLTGMYVATLDTGAGARGLNAGALHFYRRPLDALDADAVTCLVKKAVGATPAFDRKGCGSEAMPIPAAAIFRPPVD